MTALEEIKKALPDRVFIHFIENPDVMLEAFSPYRIRKWNVKPFDGGVEYVPASTLETLQRENENFERVIAGLNKQLTEQFDLSTKYVSRAEAAEAEVERLRDLLRFSHDTLWEINPSNYDHDDVCKLNDASVEVILAIAPKLGETHGKSKEWWEERQALASTGGEHHAE